MVKTISTPVVPHVSTSGIPDPATRRAIEILDTGWGVRNGNTDARFITRADLKTPKVAAEVVSTGFSSIFGANGSVGGGSVKAMVDGVAQSIMDSQLWQDLGRRIEFLTAQNNRSLRRIAALAVTEGAHYDEMRGVKLEIEGAMTAFLEEKELRINGDEALATAINTMTVKVNGYSATLQNFYSAMVNQNAAVAQQIATLQASMNEFAASVQQEASVRAHADGQISAKYTVKIDNNGYVSGYGLISEANNSAPVSSFIVRADKFAIGSPSGPGITPRAPFTVLTTTDAAGNPPGVYLLDAFIKNASIDMAKIRALEVDTLQIKGNAITVNQFGSEQGSVAAGATTFVDLLRVPVNVTNTNTVTLLAHASVIAENHTAASGWISVVARLVINNSVVGTPRLLNINKSAASSVSTSLFGLATLSAGNHLVKVQVRHDNSASANYVASTTVTADCIVQAVKR